MAASSSVKLINNASTTGPWVSYTGGWSVVSVVGDFTIPGNVGIEVMGPDGVTPILVTTFSANGRTASVNALGLAPGIYRATITGGVISAHAVLERVPE